MTAFNVLGYLAKGVGYHLARLGIVRVPAPVVITFSVTNRCQSRCRTCLIWRLYLDNPALARKELTTEEIERLFASIGSVVFLNISGGEPFLRPDLVQIVQLAIRHLRPAIIHIPTNALMPTKIEQDVSAMLSIISRSADRVRLSVKPSLDGVGRQHDEIRGVKGNFEKFLETIERLRPLAQQSPNFLLEVGTIISKLNIASVAKIASFVHTLGVQSYRNELAEVRAELFNSQEDITPSVQQYQDVLEQFREMIIANLGTKKLFTRLLESIRLVYYDLAVKTLTQQRQVLPCFAGISNAHIDPYGNVWPCCTMANDASFGNVRESGYNFYKVWHSETASRVRLFIRRKGCFCPLANQAYSNILLSPAWLARTAATFLKYGL